MRVVVFLDKDLTKLFDDVMTRLDILALQKEVMTPDLLERETIEDLRKYFCTQLWTLHAHLLDLPFH